MCALLQNTTGAQLLNLNGYFPDNVNTSNTVVNFSLKDTNFYLYKI